MALLRKKAKNYTDLFDVLREQTKTKGNQEVTFNVNGEPEVTVLQNNDKILAVKSRNVFPFNLGSRIYWDNSISKEDKEILLNTKNSNGIDEGFSDYVNAIPSVGGKLADYYLAKEISTILWLRDNYGNANNIGFSVKKSNSDLKVPENNDYEGASYGFLTIDQLEETVSMEATALVSINNALELDPVDVNNYGDTVFVLTDSNFNAEIPFDNDAENFALSAASRKATLFQAANISSGFLWSDILRAFKVLSERDVISNSTRVQYYFDETIAFMSSDHEEQSFSNYPHHEELEDQSLPELSFETDKINVSEEGEGSLLEDSTLEAELTDLSFDAVVDETDNIEVVDEISSENFYALGNDLAEVPLAVEEDVTVPVEDNGVAIPFDGLEEADLEDVSSVTLSADGSNLEKARALAIMIPMALKLNNADEHTISEITILLDENINTESLMEEMDDNIKKAHKEYGDVVATTYNGSGGSEKSNDTFLRIEALEQGRSELSTSYLENLTQVEDVIEKNKGLKAIVKIVRERIHSLIELNNLAYYSEDEITEFLGDEDDRIKEALEAGKFDEYSKAVDKELSIISNNDMIEDTALVSILEPSDEYITLLEDSDNSLPSLSEVQESGKNSPIFDKLLKDRGIDIF